MKVKINENIYDLKEALTPEEQKKGLLGVKELPKNEGMIFIQDEPKKVSFWMKDTYIPLDIIFVNDEDEVISIKKGIPQNEDALIEDNVSYVIELNKDSKVKKGDFIDFDFEDSLPVMKILAPDGSTQMELQGGERIVSRRETKILIKKAKKAYNSKSDKDYKALGKYIFKVFNKLDNRDPEYVDSPK